MYVEYGVEWGEEWGYKVWCIVSNIIPMHYNFIKYKLNYYIRQNIISTFRFICIASMKY